MLKLYENIRHYRKAAKMTQDELAKRAGYTDRSSIAKIEKGQVDLAQSKIEQFARIFGVTAGELMGWNQEEPEELQNMGALAAQLLMDRDAMEMVKEYMALSESDRYTVRLVMASISGKQKKTDAAASVVEAEKCFDKSNCDM